MNAEREAEEPARTLVAFGAPHRRSSPDGVPPEDDPLARLKRSLDRFATGLSADERKTLAALLDLGDEPALAALACEPAEAVLEREERAIFSRLEAGPAPSGQELRPYVVLIMKGTRLCNLRCTYCRSWSADPTQVMSFEVLARATRGALAAPGVGMVEFVWHGGETTLRPLSFYRKALWLQQRFRRPRQKVGNALQTNGTCLTPAWLDFLERYRITVGVSLDGPPEIHDRRRLDVGGRPTYERVRRGLRDLQARDIDHGLLVVVDDDVVALGAQRLLDCLLEMGVTKAALLNVEPEGEPGRRLPGDYLLFSRYVEFLRQLFHLWWPAHADRISIREISDLLHKVQRGRGGYCVYGENCVGHFFTIEPTGDVLHCDKYQGDSEYRFGNLLADELADLPSSVRVRALRAAAAVAREQTRRCPWFDICQGGCPHDRYVRLHRSIDHDERCCGWAPLIADIAHAVGRDPAPSTCSPPAEALRAQLTERSG